MVVVGGFRLYIQRVVRRKDKRDIKQTTVAVSFKVNDSRSFGVNDSAALSLRQLCS